MAWESIAFHEKICKQNSDLGYDQDFNFYDFSPKFYNELAKLDHLSIKQIKQDDFAKILQSIELEVEKGVQFVNKYVLETLQLLKQQGICCYLASDFYLPEELFAELLEHHELTEYFKAIFVSADHLLSKRSGRLYDYICK